MRVLKCFVIMLAVLQVVNVGASYGADGEVRDRSLTMEETRKLLGVLSIDNQDIDVSGGIASVGKFTNGDVRVETRPEEIDSGWCGRILWVIPFTNLNKLNATSVLWHSDIKRFFAPESTSGKCPERKSDYFVVGEDVNMKDLLTSIHEWERLKKCAVDKKCTLPDINLYPESVDARALVSRYGKAKIESVQYSRKLFAPSLNIPLPNTNLTLVFTYLRKDNAQELRYLTQVQIP